MARSFADEEQVEALHSGADAWQRWRTEHGTVRPRLASADLSRLDLRGADLSRADLRSANLSRVDLTGAVLSGADLSGCFLNRATLTDADLRMAKLEGATLRRSTMAGLDLSGMNLRGSNLEGADLSGSVMTKAKLSRSHLMGANLSSANLVEANLAKAAAIDANLACANLHRANLSGVNLSGADLTDAIVTQADLCKAVLTNTNLGGCDLSESHIYGISVWDARGSPKAQRGLVLSRGQPRITVDDVEVAQFLYLLINNKKIRTAIESISSRVVLLLGRFTPQRYAVLDALRDELRRHDLVPVVVDFEMPENLDIIETVTLIARLARFVIADLTEPASIPQELGALVPDVIVPVCPIILNGHAPWATFATLRRRHHWLLPVYEYETGAQLVRDIVEAIIEPAEAKRAELAG